VILYYAGGQDFFRCFWQNPGKKIAIIFHEQDRKRPGSYAVTSLAHFWRAEGIDPFFVFGTKKVLPADLAPVHVNLSVVPDEYLEYARDYPYALTVAPADCLPVERVRDRVFTRETRTGWMPPPLYGEFIAFFTVAIRSAVFSSRSLRVRTTSASTFTPFPARFFRRIGSVSPDLLPQVAKITAFFP
jgi:hypothetical protein